MRHVFAGPQSHRLCVQRLKGTEIVEAQALATPVPDSVAIYIDVALMATPAVVDACSVGFSYKRIHLDRNSYWACPNAL